MEIKSERISTLPALPGSTSHYVGHFSFSFIFHPLAFLSIAWSWFGVWVDYPVFWVSHYERTLCVGLEIYSQVGKMGLCQVRGWIFKWFCPRWNSQLPLLWTENHTFWQCKFLHDFSTQSMWLSGMLQHQWNYTHCERLRNMKRISPCYKNPLFTIIAYVYYAYYSSLQSNLFTEEKREHSRWICFSFLSQVTF